MYLITSSLIILSNFILKITDDLLDEESFENYRFFANIGIIILSLAALLVITDPEGMLLSGSIIFSAPLRKKADTIQYKWVVLFLIITFPVIYSFSDFIPNLTLERYINLDFSLLFIYFFIVYSLTSFIYDFTFKRIEKSNFVLKFNLKIILEIFLAIIIYHTFILLPVILNSLTFFAYITSILSFFAYILGAVLMKYIATQIDLPIKSPLVVTNTEIIIPTAYLNSEVTYFNSIIENDERSKASTRTFV